ncbi:hypothetical protein LEMLEM_LOCUS7275 [Lemmus lemmus]
MLQCHWRTMKRNITTVVHVCESQRKIAGVDSPFPPCES